MLVGLLIMVGLGVGAVMGVHALIGSWLVTLAILAIPLLLWFFVLVGGIMAFLKYLGATSRYRS